MSLTSGTRLGSYEILAPLGAGGMGEVYRARDTKLGREVAIKVLPEAFSRDPEKLARFQREAHLLASLNHPNVATIHGLEESEGQQFLVMELVEGETLAEHLRRGPMPADEALAVFQHIAEGLEAAHEKDIVHRDLKPSNIKISPEGKPKILDFGLAKALAGEPVVKDLSQSPTLTRDATETGVLLGTAPYMSPEQARGKPVDKRTDIWAFGCCLYEALTGKAAFLGGTVSDTIAAVLKTEPDWEALPPTTPTSIRSLLRRCLQKDAGYRLHDIADARIEIEESLTAPTPIAHVRAQISSRRIPAIIGATGIAAVVLAALGGWWLRERTLSSSMRVSRFAAPLPEIRDTDLGGMNDEQVNVSISLDGLGIVISKPSGRDGGQLYFRSMDQLDFTPISGSEGARAPFFSPDGEWVGFFKGNELRKISVHGGTPVALCEFPLGRILGGSWNPDGSIIFATERTAGLLRVSSNGGTPERLSELRVGERMHAWPDVLPNGRGVILSVLFDTSERADDGQIDVIDLSTGERRQLLNGGTYPRYSSSGHILLVRDHNLLAVPFDQNLLEVAGPPVSVLRAVQMNPMWGGASYALSREGVLVDIPGEPAERALVSVDARGELRALAIEPASFLDLRVSPDGRQVAFTKGHINHNVWVYDLERRSLTQLTTNSDHHNLIWSPDGTHLAFDRAHLPEPRDLLWKRVDSLGPTEQLLADESSILPGSWSRNGIAYVKGEQRRSLWVLPMDEERQPRCLLDATQTDALLNAFDPIFSPDGQWIAYLDRGRGTIDVIDFPDANQRWTVGQGQRPIWNPNGKELFYQNDGKLMSVEIQTDPTFAVGETRMLFEDPRLNLDYDVAPDGKTFYMIREAEIRPPTQVNVTLNWFEELKRLVPTGH